MELDTVNVHKLIGMEQGSSKDPWISRDCLFDSDTLQEVFHMDIRCCNNTDRFDCPDLGFDFGDVLALEETQEDLIGFGDSRSRNSNSNLRELNHLDEFSDDDDLALVNLNAVFPRNLSAAVRSPVLDSERPILGTMNAENAAAENEDEETENESEADRTENDGEESEEDEEEEEEEEEIENEENEHNETEYETEEESQEEEGEEDEEEEEMDGDEQETVARRRSFTPSSMEALTISPSSMVGDSRSLTASSSPTVQLMVHMQHPKMNTVSGMIKLHDIKTLSANQGGQVSQHVRKQIYNNNVHDVNSGATTMMIQTTKRDGKTALMAGHRDNPYPKPAYSYSCLIAMALKNSRTGSLPVSEIYNFMCRHFPYFKTAPNGWKNSVRHNLSLNKCFDKIEKPPGNGSQRKGCLWAIHPSKVAKMDEEVRKWSRKDPIAIKQAMVHPDHLELLERGDMKYENDRQQEEMYEDADSYVGSEMGGSAGDEIIESINDEENFPHETEKLDGKGHTMDTMDDIGDDDIIVEQFYDEFDMENDATDNEALLDTRLDNSAPKPKQPFMYELVSCAKRQKTLLSASTPGDYIYQQIDASSRRKTHLVAVRPGAAPTSGSFHGSN